MLRATLFTLLIAVSAPLSGPLTAQVSRGDPIPPSQHATLSQAVGWARLSVEYRRPVARGRDLFGSLVPWAEPWTPAADSAALFTTTAPLDIGGQPLAAGSYSIWVVPRETGAWTVVFSNAARVFHAPYPGEASDALRIDVEPDQRPHVESVQFTFPWAEGERTELHLQWGTTALAIPILVR